MGFFSKLFSKKQKKANDEVKEMEVTIQKDETESPAQTSLTEEKRAEESVKVATDGDTALETDTPDDDAVQSTFSESVSVPTKGLTGFFEIKKSKDDRYVFNLYASNRVIIATSQIYSSSKSALNGANSVIANAEKASVEDQTLKNYTPMPYPKWEIYKDKGNQFRFRLSASNGSCICHSQGYTSKASCKNGIESIIRTVKNADIQKAYITNKNQSK